MARKKSNDFLTGFLEEMEEVPSAGPGSQRAKDEAAAQKSQMMRLHQVLIWKKSKEE